MNKVTSNESVILDFIYNSSVMLIGLNTAIGNYFFVKYITGNIVGLIDKKVNFVVKYKYDAWGNILTKEVFIDCIASRHNPFVYKGYYLDLETNFYYFNSRYYNPKIHRFISIDDVNYLKPEKLDGINLYCYCMNKPIMMVDFSGRAPKWLRIAGWIGLVVGVVLCAIAIGILTCGVGTATLFCAIAVGAAKGALIGASIGIGVGAIAGGFSGANGWYNARVLEFTNYGTNDEVIIRKYIDKSKHSYDPIAKSRGSTYYGTSNARWSKVKK